MKRFIFILLAPILLFYSCKNLVGEIDTSEFNLNSDSDSLYMEFESMTNPNFFDVDFKEHSYTEAKTKALELIKEFEGFQPKRYKCYSGRTTLGYGLTAEHIKGKYTITKKEAERDLSKVYDKLYERVEEMIGDTKLREVEKASLVSLGFNIGMNRLEQSTLIKEIKKGNIKSNEIKKFVYAKNNKGTYVKLKGLEKRRIAEYELFNM